MHENLKSGNGTSNYIKILINTYLNAWIVLNILGRLIDNREYMHQDIQQRINNANRIYSTIVRIFKSKLLYRMLKVKLFIAYYIKPILTVGREAWL